MSQEKLERIRLALKQKTMTQKEAAREAAFRSMTATQSLRDTWDFGQKGMKERHSLRRGA